MEDMAVDMVMVTLVMTYPRPSPPQSAFFQFAMAFRCDQYTLPQRLQAEEHGRAVAQDNLQMELKHTRDTLQVATSPVLCQR